MDQPKFKFAMNQEVKDVVTGLKGIILCRAEYATGCRHYGIQQRVVTKEGKTPDLDFIDESRLVATGKTVDSFKGKDAEDPSGPSQDPPKL